MGSRYNEYCLCVGFVLGFVSTCTVWSWFLECVCPLHLHKCQTGPAVMLTRRSDSVGRVRPTKHTLCCVCYEPTYAIRLRLISACLHRLRSSFRWACIELVRFEIRLHKSQLERAESSAQTREALQGLNAMAGGLTGLWHEFQDRWHVQRPHVLLERWGWSI